MARVAQRVAQPRYQRMTVAGSIPAPRPRIARRAFQMQLDEQNRILIPVSELVPAVFTKSWYDSARRGDRSKIEVVTSDGKRAGRGRTAYVVYDTLCEKYQLQIRSALGDPREIVGLVPSDQSQGKLRKVERVPFNELSPKELALCNAKYNLVKAYREYAETNKAEMGLVAAKKEFVQAVQDGYLCPDSYPVVGKLSFQTLERWNKELRDGGDKMDALAPLRVQKAGSSLTPAQQKLLIDQYCTPAAPGYSQCYRMACRIWRMQGVPLEEIPRLATCRRFLQQWSDRHRHIVLMRRKGVKAVNDSCLPYLERDFSKIRFMDVLVSDGHVMNFTITHPKTGKPCRPTLVAWMDMRTQYILGFELMATENTLCVVSSFRHACLNAGRLMGLEGAVLPRAVYMDNGRAFKNKNTVGKASLEDQTAGLFERLKEYGLEQITFAKPYNASPKNIERAWRDFEEVEKMAVSYVGRNIDSKPAYLSRNECWHKTEQAKAVAAGGYPTLWGAYKIIEWFVEEYNNRVRTGEYLRGISPAQAAKADILEGGFDSRKVDRKVFDCMMMNSKTMRLTRNGFKLNGQWYYNPVFFTEVTNGQDYIVKYDILDCDRILVFREDGRFWCEAGPSLFQGVHPMASLGSEADRAKFRQAAKAQDQIKRAAIAQAVSLDGLSPWPDRLSMAASGENLLPPSASADLPAMPEPEESGLRFF